MKEKLFSFLKKVDYLFPIPLSQKQNLKQWSEKLAAYATICCEIDNGEIISLVAGYTEDVINNMGYISVVATLPEAQGRGYAAKLVHEFLGKAKGKGLDAVHLYTVESNVGAVSMYKKLGFVDYKVSNELRSNDLHLIYNFSEEIT